MMPATTVFEAAPSLSSDPITSAATPPADIAIAIEGARALLAGPGMALDLEFLSVPKGTPCPCGWSRVPFSDHDLFVCIAAVVRSPAAHRGL